VRSAFAVRVLMLLCLVAAGSCRGGNGGDAPPQMAPEPQPPLRVPREVSRMIVRLSSVEFNLDRRLLGLLARPEAKIGRDELNTEIVFDYYGLRMKLSPDKSAETWAAQLYADLDARIERRQQAARAVLIALGAKAEELKGPTSWDQARAALHRAEEPLDAAVARQESGPHFEEQVAAYKRAVGEAQQFYAWKPNIAGTLPGLLGFADLDRIQSVNGTPVRSYAEIYYILAKLGSADHIDVDLIREDAPVHLTYHIVSIAPSAL
jgi:hypothetical protein